MSRSILVISAWYWKYNSPNTNYFIRIPILPQIYIWHDDQFSIASKLTISRRVILWQRNTSTGCNTNNPKYKKKPGRDFFLKNKQNIFINIFLKTLSRYLFLTCEHIFFVMIVKHSAFVWNNNTNTPGEFFYQKFTRIYSTDKECLSQEQRNILILWCIFVFPECPIACTWSYIKDLLLKKTRP